MKRTLILILILMLITIDVIACTIGVASHTITTSDKPILWKSRDKTPTTINSIRYVDNMTYNFVGISTPGENRVWMGVNEMGFALANSLSYDLTVDVGDYNNGNLIYNALGLVSNLNEFENFLDYMTSTTSISLELRGNFVAFDAEGNTKLYEINNNNYWVFETDDTENPYLLRTNHSVIGGSFEGIERLNRSAQIIQDLVEDNELSVNNLLLKQVRDISDRDSQPYALPLQYGDPTSLFNTEYSICRRNTVSAVVIEGVQPGQDPKLTTMWLIMGNPFVTQAIPIFPTIIPNVTTINNLSENSPELVNIIWNRDNNYLLDTSNFVNASFSLLQEFENKEVGLYQSLEDLKTQWGNQEINDSTITSFINQNATSALNFSTEIFYNLTPNEDNEVVPAQSLQVYPNPFQTVLTIKTKTASKAKGQVSIYNLKGQLVKTISSALDNNYSWNGKDNKNDNLPNGVYLIKYESAVESVVQKVVLLK